MADRDFLLEFGTFQELLNGCASRISEEGMYFEAAETGAVGSDVAFEVRIRGSFSVLRGEGEIVGVTDEGIFVRLIYLDQPSLKLLPKLVEHYRRHGIPPLELPEAPPIEVAETEEKGQDEGLEVVSEPTADDLFPVEEAVSPSDQVGLTLDDLEAEFLVDRASPEGDQEPRFDGQPRPSTLLVDASPASSRQDIETATEIESENEPGLIDPGELIANTTDAAGTFAPDEIHLNEDPVAEELPQGEAAESEDQLIEVDSGLPWLPDESEPRRGKELWVILLWVVLGVALGVAFYFLVLRTGEESGRAPADPTDIQTRVVPAARATVEPSPITAQTEAPLSEENAVTKIQIEDSAEAAPVAILPRVTEPPTELLTRVNRITWADESNQTVITFWGDGRFVAEQVDDFRVVGGAPREVVRIRGVRSPFAERQIDLDSDHVRRIRVGLHEEADGLALHFVADLVDGDVELLRTEAAGEQLRVYFGKAG